MAAVRVFYMRVMNDDLLRPFFEDIDLARLKNKLVCHAPFSFWTVCSMKEKYCIICLFPLHSNCSLCDLRCATAFVTIQTALDFYVCYVHLPQNGGQVKCCLTESLVW